MHSIEKEKMHTLRGAGNHRGSAAGKTKIIAKKLKSVDIGGIALDEENTQSNLL